MSERGTWVTEHIYCQQCVDRFQEFLIDSGCGTNGEKYWSYVKLSPWSFAGRISGLYSGEELHDWDSIAEDLGKVLCHPVRVAVISDTAGEKIYKIGGEQ